MDDFRMAGTEFELDIRDGLSPFNLNEMRRAFRRDKLIPRSLVSDFNEMAPENSEPGYGMSGSYQPEVSYGI